jgi:RNA polymerase sigma-70 factor, ECF subfamily
LATAIQPSEAPRLLAEVASGDAAAFEQLYDTHSSILYGLLLKMLGNAEDAQEVLQEAFVQVWNRAGSYDASRGSELAWLISITRSRGIDRLRSRRVRSEREQQAALEISKGSENVDTPGAYDEVVTAERGAALREALVELPEGQRQALELAYFHGLSQTEIAAKLSEPLGTVKTRMQLGMKKLRERLRQSYR